jgi:hypothetical protein
VISRGARPPIVSPLSWIVPFEDLSRPAIALSRVDLPAPLGPMMQAISPA